MKNIIPNILTYLLLIGAGFMVLYPIFNFYRVSNTIARDFSQPKLPPENSWSIRSIDTQIVSKHWQGLTPERIREQVLILKDLNVNFIAIGTSYDNDAELAMWTKEIHNAGLSVWFRSTWNKWEGTNKQPDTMTPQEYLEKTHAFIINHPDLFKEQDAVTLSVEPEQAGIGLGKKFKDWGEYKQFILDQIIYANDAFKKIGLEGKIYTNWIPVSAWIAEYVFDKELVDLLGIIVIDHHGPQTQTIGEEDNLKNLLDDMSITLDKLYNKWQKPILLGKWGYQIHQETEEDVQDLVMKNMLELLRKKPYLLGVNYWAHMGNTSRIINDQYSSKLANRKATLAIQEFFR